MKSFQNFNEESCYSVNGTLFLSFHEFLIEFWISCIWGSSMQILTYIQLSIQEIKWDNTKSVKTKGPRVFIFKYMQSVNKSFLFTNGHWIRLRNQERVRTWEKISGFRCDSFRRVITKGWALPWQVRTSSLPGLLELRDEGLKYSWFA